MTNINISILDLRNVSAALLALAVKELFPGVVLGESGVTSFGFYCDFISDVSFTSQVLKKIEERMDQAVFEKKPVAFKEMTPANAREYFLFHKEPYLAKLANAQSSSTLLLVDIAGKMFFTQHQSKIKNLGEIGAIKIFKSEVLEGFQKRVRIHGAVFFNKQEKKEFLKTSDELIGVSHINYGLEKNLFEEVEKGRFVWLPKGQKIKSLLNQKIENLLEEYGLLAVSTLPVMESFSRKDFFIQHKGIFESQELTGQRFAISESVTICESEDKIFSSGLLDTPNFQINISHFFVERELLLEEVISYLHFMTKIFKILGFAFEIALVGRPKSEESEILAEGLRRFGLDFLEETDKKEAFRVEWRLQDRMGITWPVSCLYAPQKLSQSPYVCLPASLCLSLERWVGLIVEGKKGEIPFWLAPCQVRVIPVQVSNQEYAEKVVSKLKKLGIRAENEKEVSELKPKLRKAFAEDIPFVLAVGDKEAEGEKVSLRRGGIEPKSLSLEELIEMWNQ